MAQEIYELASHPPSSPLFLHAREASEVLSDEPDLPGNRELLLRIGIDVKSLVTSFFVQLEADHGRRRVDLLADWLVGGYSGRYSDRQRQQLYADRRRLARIIRQYRGGV